MQTSTQQVRSISRRSAEKYKEAIVTSAKSNPKDFGVMPRRCSVTQLVQNACKIDDPQAITKSLCNRFASVFTSIHGNPLPDSPRYDILSTMSSITISRADLETCLRNVNQNKSFGPNDNQTQLLREAHAELSLTFTHLFKKSRDLKCILTDWKIAYITPVNKGGDRNQAVN